MNSRIRLENICYFFFVFLPDVFKEMSYYALAVTEIQPGKTGESGECIKLWLQDYCGIVSARRAN